MDKSIFFQLVLFAAVVLWIVFQLGKYYGRYKGNKAALKRLEQLLHNLTADEKAYLSHYVIDGENTQYFKTENGVAETLEKKKIIYKSSSVDNLMSDEAYNIQPWAKEYLVKNPHLLEGTTQIRQASSSSKS